MLDAQFIDQMGSSYLLAHGLGNPVAEARTDVAFPESGSYAVWVRTKDWIPAWNPGRFKVRVNGKVYSLPAEIKLARYQKHNIEVVVDSVKLIKENRTRITDAIETAMDISSESQITVTVNEKKEVDFNTQLYCSTCELYFENIQPRSFSFNSPFITNRLTCHKHHDPNS